MFHYYFWEDNRNSSESPNEYLTGHQSERLNTCSFLMLPIEKIILLSSCFISLCFGPEVTLFLWNKYFLNSMTMIFQRGRYLDSQPKRKYQKMTVKKKGEHSYSCLGFTIVRNESGMNQKWPHCIMASPWN